MITIRTDFGTNNGPPCTCGGTIYTYQVQKGSITTQCNGCHRYDYVRVRHTQPVTAVECSALHRSSQTQAHLT